MAHGGTASRADANGMKTARRRPSDGRSQAAGVNESGGVVAENKHAFEDLTDFQVSVSRLFLGCR